MAIRLSRRWTGPLAAAGVLAGALSASAVRAEPREEVDVAFETVSLAAFFERMATRLGSPITQPASLAGTVTVHARDRVSSERARQLVASIAELRGLWARTRSDGSIAILPGGHMSEAARSVYSLTYRLEELAVGWPDPRGMHTASVVGSSGVVTLRSPSELHPDAVRAMQDALSARSPGATSLEPSVVLAHDRVVLLDALRSVTKVLTWGPIVSDDDLLQRSSRVDIETEKGVPLAAVELHARALLAVAGLESVEGAGLRYTRSLGSPDVERISPSVAERIAKPRFAAPVVIPPRREGIDLAWLLEKLGGPAGLRMVWAGSCSRRVLVWGEELRTRELSGLVEAILESLDLVAREGRGGEIEIAPRASCSDAREAEDPGSPHPTLAALGVRSGDAIVSVDGAPASELDEAALYARLRAADTAILGVRTVTGELTGVTVPAQVLLALLGG